MKKSGRLGRKLSLLVGVTLLCSGITVALEIEYSAEYLRYDHAVCVSTDGSVIIGNECCHLPWIWVNGIASSLSPSPVPGYYDWEVTAASADCSVAVGAADWSRAIIWKNGINTNLGINKRPVAVSDDGSTVLFADGYLIVGEEFVSPQPPPDSNIEELTDISGDGTIITGSYRIGETVRGAVWTNGVASDPLASFPEFPKDEFTHTEITAVSNDGTCFLVLRRYRIFTNETLHYFILDKGNLVLLEPPVAERYSRVEVHDLSLDGSVVIGKAWVTTDPDLEDGIVLWRRNADYTPKVFPESIYALGNIRRDSLFRISGDGSTAVGGAENRVVFRYFWGTYEVSGGYCDTTPWMGWLWVENDPWVWSVDMNHWLYCPGENFTESGAWAYIPK
jgi:hypothetical protein